ncbi:unnamed protein product [Meganyctiphanes norvegica]|uniref:Uncharacterized protein n=1 Tax=Meganyctiphanes norvegica TaxID=48144 RepID=A0AAV2S112_MEGNR
MNIFASDPSTAVKMAPKLIILSKINQNRGFDRFPTIRVRSSYLETSSGRLVCIRVAIVLAVLENFFEDRIFFEDIFEDFLEDLLFSHWCSSMFKIKRYYK